LVAVQPRHFESLSGPLNVLDLRHFTAADLRPLLREEAREWEKCLHWDYSGSAEMILRYAESRILPGYAVLEKGKVVAYTFFVYEGNKAVIGDCFASEKAEESQDELRLQLLGHVLETLQQSPGTTRIESQLLLQSSGALAEPFENTGFRSFRRLFMSVRATDLSQIERRSRVPGVKIRRWHESDFQNASVLITRAYAGHVDSTINDQYRTAAGSLRFLNNIVRFPGCGAFDSNASLVALDEQTGTMVGLLLCSHVRSDVAHITQVCLLPSFRGRGLGRLLIGMCAEEIAAHRLKTLTLTVTEGNTSAVELYRVLGFKTERNFDAFVWER
jgi:ribosomal protein S18 acetylase RimI-like enzyme